METKAKLVAAAMQIEAEAHHIKYDAVRTGRFKAKKPRAVDPARKAKRKAQRMARAITRKKG